MVTKFLGGHYCSWLKALPPGALLALACMLDGSFIKKRKKRKGVSVHCTYVILFFLQMSIATAIAPRTTTSSKPGVPFPFVVNIYV